MDKARLELSQASKGSNFSRELLLIKPTFETLKSLDFDNTNQVNHYNQPRPTISASH